MIALRNLFWIWTISYLIVLWWLKRNPKVIKDFYVGYCSYLDYDFFTIFYMIVTFIIAPLVAFILVLAEIYIFLYFLPRKIIIWFKIWGVDDKELRKELRKKLRNL